jgi:D-alanine-D-alanine ligase
VGVIYGGVRVNTRSPRLGRRRVSEPRSGAYEAIPIRINKDGRWVLPSAPPRLTSAAEVIAAGGAASADAPGKPPGTATRSCARPGSQGELVEGVGLDVVFPAIHGPYGEDGTVQGLLELANVPYVGCGVLASATGMDKAAMKLAFAARGLPICDYEVVLKHEWRKNEHRVLNTVGRLGFPLFVKPANLGSASASRRPSRRAARRDHARREFDRKIIVEAAVPNAREIEVRCSATTSRRHRAGRDRAVARVLHYEAKYRRRVGAAIPRRQRGADRRVRASPSRRSRPSTGLAWHASISSSPATAESST